MGKLDRTGNLARFAGESNWSVAILAQKSGVSVSTLERRTKKEAGLTPKNFVIKIKMDEAVRLLVEEQLSVEGTALELGYSYKNTHHFSRDFKKFFGYSPRQQKQSK